MKNFRSALLAAALSLVVAAGSATAAQATTKIRVGASPTPHAEILKVANDVLKPQGYELQIIEYSDYVQPNMALEGKELDANFFQHKPYLDDSTRKRAPSWSPSVPCTTNPSASTPARRSPLAP